MAIRVHGNYVAQEADVVALSGLVVGEPATQATIDAAADRLKRSGRFSDVTIQRRYASIADPAQVLLVIVVDEWAAAEDIVPGIDPAPGPIRRVRAAAMWMPIVSFADGYGFTYGARVAFVEPFGPRSRIAVPLTWGGERRAGVEVERTFERGALSAVRGSAAIYRRVNPHYEVTDMRRELRATAERSLTPWLRAFAGARTAQVTFGGVEDRHDAVHAGLTVDSRTDPTFPRNAVYASGAFERLRVRERALSATIVTGDVRGFVGAGGSRVIAARVTARTSNAPLPPAEQVLLGGSDTLRGYRAGVEAGDNVATASLELRAPVNSPLSVGRFGLKAFVDFGTTWNYGEHLQDQRIHRGIGGGIYFGGGPVIGDLAVAWPRSGDPRIHFALGLTF